MNDFLLTPDDLCEERPSDEGNAADELEADYAAFLRAGGVPMRRVAGRAGSQVGAKKKLVDDPEARAEAIREHAKRKPLEALLHPNCPPDLFAELAVEYPIEAMSAPSLPLHMIEDAGFWLKIEEENAEKWYDGHLQRLKERDQRLLAADCAERVLPRWEEEHPNDKRPREAINAARAYAEGQISEKEFEAARSAARYAAYDAASYAAYDAAYYAAYSAANSAASAAANSAAYDAARKEFYVWAWHRLLAYLYGSVKLLSCVEKYQPFTVGKGTRSPYDAY